MPKDTKDKKKSGGGGQGPFLVAAIALSFIVVPFIYYSFSLYFAARAHRPDYPWPELTEMWKAFVSGTCFLATKKLVVYLTYDCNRTWTKD